MAAQHMAPQAPTRKKHRILPVILILLVLAACGAGGYVVYTRFLTFSVTVNGRQATVRRGDTVQTLIDQGYAQPAPGNLLAIDGSLLTEGAGEVCRATIGGNAVEPSAPLSTNAVVQIDDGGDITEEVTEAEESIPFQTSNDDTSYGSYYLGSIHLLSKGVEGKKLVKTGTVSGKTVEETIASPIDAGYRVYTARPVDRVVALTFDDGPWPESTTQILDLLEQYGAKATFFAVGEQVQNLPDLVKRADAMGCQVLTHTWDHNESAPNYDLAQMTEDEQVAEIQQGYEAIADVLGEEPAHIMRAPGGSFYGEVISNLWPYVDAEIGWDIDTEDWKQPGADQVASMILSAQPGQVILMHDGGGDRSQTVAALKTALPKLVEQGYTFVTIDELLAYGVPS